MAVAAWALKTPGSCRRGLLASEPGWHARTCSCSCRLQAAPAARRRADGSASACRGLAAAPGWPPAPRHYFFSRGARGPCSATPQHAMPPRPADLGATARDNIPRRLPRETRSAWLLLRSTSRWLRLTRWQGMRLDKGDRAPDRSIGAAATPASESDPSKARGSLSERT